MSNFVEPVVVNSPTSRETSSKLDGVDPAASSPQVKLSSVFSSLDPTSPFTDCNAESPDYLYRDPIDFTIGEPDSILLPYDRLAASVDRVIHGTNAYDALAYSDFGGYGRLREQIADWRRVNPTNVLITNGAMQGIYLAAAALIDRESDDAVLMEEPVFPEARRIFQLAGARVDPIPMTQSGPDLDAVEKALRTGKYKAFYTVSDFQNPTGTLIDAEGKRRLAQLAERYGIAIVADNPYHDLWFNQEPAQFPQELRMAQRGAHLFEIGSFSKILGPGLRLGWLIADAETVRLLASYRRSLDGHPSTFMQYVVSDVLSDTEWFHGFLAHTRAFYAAKAQVLYQALAEAFSMGTGTGADNFSEGQTDDSADGAASLVLPQGGYFLWGTFPAWFDLSSPQVRYQLSRFNVHVLPGTAFYFDSERAQGRRTRNTARLSFARLPESDLVEGARRLGEINMLLRQ